MSPKSKKPSTSKTQERGEAWRPRVVEDHSFNAFENDHEGPDSVPPSSKIQDAAEDTAPLQGTHDRSDDDSLTAANDDAGDDKEPPNDRTTLGR